MKKIIHATLLFLAIGIATTACKKEKTAFAEENPLSAYLAATGFNVVDNKINTASSEFGLAFSPNVKGQINAITVKIPDVNPSLKVTIWDYTTKTVLRTEIVNVTSSNVITTKPISPLALEKDKKYMITMNSQDWYKEHKADNSAATYPITAGNIKIWEYSWIGGSAQAFPTNIDPTYYAGDLSFVFQQTE